MFLSALHFSLKLEEGGVFKSGFDAFAALAAWVSWAWAFALQAPPQKSSGLLIVGRPIQHGTELCSSVVEPALPPQRIPDVEPVIGFGLVALQRFAEVFQSAGAVV